MNLMLPLVEAPSGRWEELPSAKPTVWDKALFGRWVNLYTAYSEQFARDVLNIFEITPKSVVLDPFVGSGTTLEAARDFGCEVIGVDLDPFSAVVAKARVAQNIDHKRLQSFLRYERNDEEDSKDKEINKLFSRQDARFLIGAIRRVLGNSSKRAAERLRHILANSGGQYDTEVVALASLLIAANYSKRAVRGSNPVWIRAAVKGEEMQAPSVQKMLQQIAVDLAKVGERNRDRPASFRAAVILGDARAMAVQSGAVDAILTSPPYLNRLDYIVSHLPAVSVLGSVVGTDVPALRRQMIGTTLIGAKVDLASELPRSSQDILRSIKAHPSKASASYYYWNYQDYLISMRSLFQECRRVLKRGGHVAMVIQNSYYKDLEVPIDRLAIDIASQAGLTGEIAKSETVRSHYGLISPRQRSYVSQKVLRECVLHFRKR